MIPFLIAQIIINSFRFGGAPAVGGEGYILQEDGFFLMQQDTTSKILKEFSLGGFILQENNFFLMQQDSTSKIQKQ